LTAGSREEFADGGEGVEELEDDEDPPKCAENDDCHFNRVQRIHSRLDIQIAGVLVREVELFDIAVRNAVVVVCGCLPVTTAHAQPVRSLRHAVPRVDGTVSICDFEGAVSRPPFSAVGSIARDSKGDDKSRNVKCEDDSCDGVVINIRVNDLCRYQSQKNDRRSSDWSRLIMEAFEADHKSRHSAKSTVERSQVVNHLPRWEFP